ncbi:MAG: helix-turn-helix transcriptional regulator, partial [Cyanobacteria bacterium J06607_6]
CSFPSFHKAAGLTQQQLANMARVAVRTIQGWESGDYIPALTPLQFWLLCRALKCSAEDLARDFFPEEFESDGEFAADVPGDLAPN